MTEYMNTIIVGGGQGGLATSYFLQENGHQHVIFEKAHRPAQAWRNRWDSFTLVTPNWMTHLPGSKYQGPDPEGFMTRDEIIAFFESYIREFQLPVRYGIRVTSIESHGIGYLVKTEQGDYKAANVVVATGFYQKPKIPACSASISSDILQVHSSEYRNPQSLPPGGVLVVGSAQSGSQMAEELHQSGRNVHLSVSGAGRIPRRYRGKDVSRWMEKLGFFTRKVDELKSPAEKFAASAHLSGKDGGHTINLHQFARDGIVLLGQVDNASGYQIRLADDLKENLAKADEFEKAFLSEIDQYIEENHLNIPKETPRNLTDGYAVDEIHSLNLKKAGIKTIIWATGYRPDFSLVKLPVLDDDGYPIQNQGVTRFPGLYFIGLPFLHTGISGVIAGVGADAKHITFTIFERECHQMAPQKIHAL